MTTTSRTTSTDTGSGGNGTGTESGGSTRRRRRRRQSSTLIVATSVKNGPVTKTAAGTRRSVDQDEQQQSLLFHQRVFALLVLQYTFILILSSPMALLKGIQTFLHDRTTLRTVVEWIAVSGIVLTIFTAVCCGSRYPFAHICLGAITIFVGLELGLSFAETPGLYVAIGQATTSFALLLALMQLDLESSAYPMAVGLCLVAAGLWTMILVGVGRYTVWTCLAISGTGFGFVCIVLCASYHVEHFVAPDEYVLATLFILCPEALLCMPGSSKRTIPDATAEALGEGELLLGEEA